MGTVLPLFVLLVTVQATSDGAGKDDRRRELGRHQGAWRVTSFISDGVQSPPEVARSIVRVVEGDHVVWKRGGKSFAGTTVELDPVSEPKAIDVIPDGGRSRGKRVPGIYKFDGDELIICMAGPDQDRPKTFEARKGSGRTLMRFKRESK
jgi:uncharacterized protein (TIGR03067 family)